jgi:hypothetical protein
MNHEPTPLARKQAALKALATEADELAFFLASLDGNDHPTPNDFKFVWSLPRFNRKARARIFAEQI